MSEEIRNVDEIQRLIETNKERYEQVKLALGERLHILQNTDARYQYLLATMNEIENQINQLKDLTKNLNDLNI